MPLFPDTDPATWPLGIVTCRNEDCLYNGVANALPMWQGVEQTFTVCGGCGVEITDRKPAPDGTPIGVVEPEPQPEPEK